MVSQIPPEQAVHDIPVKTVSSLAIKTVMGNLPALVQMALFPFLLSALITALSIPSLGNALSSWILSILAYIPHTLFTVAWHRRTLLNLQAPESTSITSWNRVHWQFLLKIIILLAIFYGMSLIGTLPVLTIGAAIPALVPFLFLGLIVVMLYVVARLSFILPATAVGEKYTLDTSWKHTDKQGWRIVAAFLMLTIPFGLLMLLIAMFAFGSLFTGMPTTPEDAANFNILSFIQNNGPAFFFLQLIILAVTYLPTAAVISMLSIAFKGCTGWVPEASSSSADEEVS
ncbi:hypothetical protein [Kiloniella majae]|uniref:hypothetical protein n=1 Tax=Kiloniella majae TaxID=1938558 RepID=UPI000A277123|nr:hypothetical protein [Kiloniella majae]